MSSSAIEYIKGLFQAGKKERNIERMCEKVAQSDYHRIQHFISESPWDASAVMGRAAQDTNELFKRFSSVGLIIDESGEEKKGSHSVGVAPQYCGNIGKIANSQVGVYGCLAAGKYANLIDTRLYLPREWTDDSARCKKAGIPKEHQQFKKKTELALEIICSQRKAGIRFDWVGADAFYGNDYDFLKKLDKYGELFVIDIHSDQHIFLEKPQIAVPEKKGLRGRQPALLKADKEAMAVNSYVQDLRSKDWKSVKLRDGAKGELKSKVHVQKVYTWNKEDENVCERLLIIRRTRKKNGKVETKYALSNAKEAQYKWEELALMQAQRFWIEHALKEAKQQIGMSEYQVRGWLAWHHHMAMVMKALYFVLSEKILHQNDIPLLSAYDLRQMMIHYYAEKTLSKETLIKQMKKRHRQRQNDIDKYYQKKAVT